MKIDPQQKSVKLNKSVFWQNVRCFGLWVSWIFSNQFLMCFYFCMPFQNIQHFGEILIYRLRHFYVCGVQKLGVIRVTTNINFFVNVIFRCLINKNYNDDARNT
eukprot:UN09257